MRDVLGELDRGGSARKWWGGRERRGSAGGQGRRAGLVDGSGPVAVRGAGPAIGLERNVLEEEFGEPGSEPCRFELCLRHPAAGHVETDELEAPRMAAFALDRIDFAYEELLRFDEQPDPLAGGRDAGGQGVRRG